MSRTPLPPDSVKRSFDITLASVEWLARAMKHSARTLREALNDEEEPEPEEQTEPTAVAPAPIEIHFAFDKPSAGGGPAGVLDPDKIEAAVAAANQHAGATVSVVGHASVEGTDAYNEALGKRRADHVAGRIRAEADDVTVNVSSLGESVAGQAEGERRDADWRKVRVTIQPVPPGAK